MPSKQSNNDYFLFTYPNLINDRIPFIHPNVLCKSKDSGDLSVALDTAPGGECDGRKNEKTLGISCAICPIQQKIALVTYEIGLLNENEKIKHPHLFLIEGQG